MVALLEKTEIGENLVTDVLSFVLRALRRANNVVGEYNVTLSKLSHSARKADEDEVFSAAKAVVAECVDLIGALKLDFVWDLLVSLADSLFALPKKKIKEKSEDLLITMSDDDDEDEPESVRDLEARDKENIGLLETTMDKISAGNSAEIQQAYLPRLLSALLARCVEAAKRSSPPPISRFVPPLGLCVLWLFINRW